MSGRKKTSRKGRRSQEEQEEASGEEETEYEEGEEEEEGGEEEEEEEAVPPPTKKELKQLFGTYQKAADAIAELEMALVQAKEAESEAIGAIAERAGTGPFGWKKKKLRIISRRDKYFMRIDEDELQEIG